MPDINGADHKKFGEAFLTDILEWVARWFSPEEVFTTDELTEWAEENDWTQEA